MSRKKLELTHPQFPGAFGKLDRRGGVSWQYGRGGGAYHIPGEPGDAEFLKRYQQLAEIQAEQENYIAELSNAYLRPVAISDVITYPPRGLSRYEAARYVGVAPKVFDEMVVDGTMPRCKRLRAQAIWDRVQLDIAFNALDSGDGMDKLRESLRESRSGSTL
ncbi:hypothetical protein [Rhizobium giardinii]|uniref:Uncharacterized protein n=1 Tax=Rhizobium giardinii TaxID=56731 RepID=A0A7W8X755_9HYPH|nr:hypothetical protein [Rhizobium giardinii]MBB5534152.1 hypothetical protein [Rhizobium giardinii]